MKQTRTAFIKQYEGEEENRQPSRTYSLDYIKVLTRAGKGSPATDNNSGWKITGDVGCLVIQMPLENSELVAHVEITASGKVLICFRKKIFDGSWSKEKVFDIQSEVTMAQLAGEEIWET